MCVFFKLAGSERKFPPISQVNFPFLYNHIFSYFMTDVIVCHIKPLLSRNDPRPSGSSDT